MFFKKKEKLGIQGKELHTSEIRLPRSKKWYEKMIKNLEQSIPSLEVKNPKEAKKRKRIIQIYKNNIELIEIDRGN
jgi:hypothetical protein